MRNGGDVIFFLRCDALFSTHYSFIYFWFLISLSILIYLKIDGSYQAKRVNRTSTVIKQRTFVNFESLASFVKNDGFHWPPIKCRCCYIIQCFWGIFFIYIFNRSHVIRLSNLKYDIVYPAPRSLVPAH